VNRSALDQLTALRNLFRGMVVLGVVVLVGSLVLIVVKPVEWLPFTIPGAIVGVWLIVIGLFLARKAGQSIARLSA
jgi:xanthine/uracil permease